MDGDKSCGKLGLEIPRLGLKNNLLIIFTRPMYARSAIESLISVIIELTNPSFYYGVKQSILQFLQAS
jgi:hypothetical protein